MTQAPPRATVRPPQLLNLPPTAATTHPRQPAAAMKHKNTSYCIDAHSFAIISQATKKFSNNKLAAPLTMGLAERDEGVENLLDGVGSRPLESPGQVRRGCGFARRGQRLLHCLGPRRLLRRPGLLRGRESLAADDSQSLATAPPPSTPDPFLLARRARPPLPLRSGAEPGGVEAEPAAEVEGGRESIAIEASAAGVASSPRTTPDPGH